MANITAKEAIRIVQEYFQYATGDYATRLNLEEIEKAKDGNNWLVTMSFEESSNFIATGRAEERRTREKVFEIHGTTGEVLSMKNPPSGF